MQIAIIGCGWLGLPLALSLQKRGCSIAATRRSEEGCNELTKQGITSFKYQLGDNIAVPEYTPLFNSSVLILNIPVGRKSPAADSFLHHMEQLINHALENGIQHLVFISTTSVYGDLSGNIIENSTLNPQTQSAKINVEVENLVRQYFAEQATVMRLAGLVGDDRHPVKYLAGKTELANPEQPVNLIHQLDVINAIESIVADNLWGKTLHLSATSHPSRKEYYTWAAKQLGLAPPQFIVESGQSDGKRIDAKESLAKLGLELIYPSPYDMLGKH